MMIQQVQRQEVGTESTITEAEAKQYLRAASGGVHGSRVNYAAGDQVDVPVTKGRNGDAGSTSRRTMRRKRKLTMACTG